MVAGRYRHNIDGNRVRMPPEQQLHATGASQVFRQTVVSRTNGTPSSDRLARRGPAQLVITSASDRHVFRHRAVRQSAVGVGDGAHTASSHLDRVAQREFIARTSSTPAA